MRGSPDDSDTEVVRGNSSSDVVDVDVDADADIRSAPASASTSADDAAQSTPGSEPAVRDPAFDTRAGTATPISRIDNPEARNGGQFRPLYDSSERDERVEVRIESRNRTDEGPAEYVINRPDWDSPKTVSGEDLTIVTEDDLA